MKVFLRTIKKRSVICSMTLMLGLNGVSQVVKPTLNKTNELFPECISVNYTEYSNSPSFIEFGSTSKIKFSDVKDLLSETLKIKANERLFFCNKEKDKYGFVHYRFQQYYENIKVEGGQYIVHEKNGNVISANGFWLDGLNLDVVPKITEKNALTKALLSANALVYKWQVPEEELLLKKSTGNNKSTYFPKAELSIVAKNFDYKNREYHCCYKFEIYASSPLMHNFIYVDINDGEVIATENRICSIDVPATAVTKYSGSQLITVDSVSPGSYRLRETSRGQGIETYNMHNSTNFAGATDFTNSTSLWNTTTNYDNAAYDVHWGLQSTYDYYLNLHNRNSVDNMGMKLTSYVHYGAPGTFEASHISSGEFAFNDGTNVAGGYKPYTSLDICAHEYTHGVTEFSAALHYGSESGALNESFSDIFSACVEFYKKPATANYLLGDEVGVTPGTYFRNMGNPNLKSHPDTYGGTFWSTSPADFGGVHINTGVQNFWFYLLCNGGVGTNDLGNNYNVASITMSKAQLIAYRSLTVYLTPFSNYADARFYSIKAAEDLYGVCSPEVVAVTNAWYAVGVGTSYNALADANFVSNSTYSCSLPIGITFQNRSINATTANWDFGDGTTSTLMNPTHVYNNSGIYSVKLRVGGNCGNDSIIMNSLITINAPVAPSVIQDSVCGPGVLNLSASGSGTLNWYSAPSGGASIQTGTNYVTPVLNSTTTYYVDNQTPGTTSNVGPTVWAGQFGDLHKHYMRFNVLQNSILVSVKTNSYIAGTRNIVLKNNQGVTIQTATVNLPIGPVTINLNFLVPAGIGYALGGDSLYFAFDGSNTAYPYTLPNVASITGNTLSNAVYLFFYDWQFQTNACSSERSSVSGLVYSNPLVTLNTSLYDTLCESDASVVLSGGLPAGGLYSGIGISAGSFDPSISGAGLFPITYSYTDSHGCSGVSSTSNINVISTVNCAIGINKGNNLQQGISLYPNPAKDFINVTGITSTRNDGKLFVTNAIGQVLISEKISIQNNSYKTKLSVANLPCGVYFITLEFEGKKSISKFSKIE
jgi:Zn-dependent metalloprotease